MLLLLTNISKAFGTDVILEEVCLSVGEGDRIGLLGANGAGKTTLLSIISGELECDAGEVSLARGAEIGYLRQNGALDPGNTLSQEIYTVFCDLLQMGRELEKLREALAASPAEAPDHAALLERYGLLNNAFESREGYMIDVNINKVLSGMGFGSYDRSLPVASLSGGEKTRLAIAKLLLRNPQLLILDEPTNHLDFVTLEWLEDYLKAYRGALIIVSHDRYFLDNVVTHICELERRRLTRYPGGYSQFVRLKKERRDYQQKQYERQQEKIEKLEDYVARNLTRASTSNMAKSRIHMLEHLERADRPAGEGKPTRLRFEMDAEPYQDVLIAEDISVCVGEGASRRELCGRIGLHIERGEKVALIGQNGVGKSSLLKSLMNQMEHGGRVKWGANVKISYFEQENRQLDWNASVMDEVRRRFPRHTDVSLRTLLGSILLSGDDVYKKIGGLSGGERAKVAFAIIMLERANVLILDEPTNHLDYKTKEILEEALIEYPGAILMVSHDRYMLNRVPTRLIEMFPDRLTSYGGGYDYYLSHRALPAFAQDGPRNGAKDEAQANEKQSPFYRSKAQRSEQARRKNRIAALESEIGALEGRISALEAQAASPDYASDYQKLEECCRALDEARGLLALRTDEWCALCEEGAQ